MNYIVEPDNKIKFLEPDDRAHCQCRNCSHLNCFDCGMHWARNEFLKV